MRLDSIFGKILRRKVCALIGAGSLYVVVAGCDPQVQNALVSGLADAAISTVETWFTRSETPVQPGVGPIPTVMLDTPSSTVSA